VRQAVSDPTLISAIIYLIRSTRWTMIDLSGAMDGSAAADVSMTAGDKLVIQVRAASIRR